MQVDAGEDVRDYQLISAGGVWHLTQQQARPPKRDELACHTSCGKWAEMKDGFQRGRPTCPTCLEHVSVFEEKDRETIVIDLETSTRLDFLVETAHPTDVFRAALYAAGRRRRAML